MRYPSLPVHPDDEAERVLLRSGFVEMQFAGGGSHSSTPSILVRVVGLTHCHPETSRISASYCQRPGYPWSHLLRHRSTGWGSGLSDDLDEGYAHAVVIALWDAPTGGVRPLESASSCHNEFSRADFFPHLVIPLAFTACFPKNAGTGNVPAFCGDGRIPAGST
jgi:hypothetical protein